jgi:elongation factor P hydroxylase
MQKGASARFRLLFSAVWAENAKDVKLDEKRRHSIALAQAHYVRSILPFSLFCAAGELRRKKEDKAHV